MKALLKNFFLFLFSSILGFLATISAYIFVTHQKIQVISPVNTSKFSLDKAPGLSLAGSIKSLSGNVLWQSRVANNSILITKPQAVAQGEELSTGNNGKVEVIFPDCLLINVSNNSQFNIIQTLKTNIVIQQIMGEIVYVKLSSIPVSIRALDLLVNIKNGQINLTVDKDKSTVSVLVKDGSIQVAFKDLNNVSNVIVLNKGKTFNFNNNTKEIY